MPPPAKAQKSISPISQALRMRQHRPSGGWGVAPALAQPASTFEEPTIPEAEARGEVILCAGPEHESGYGPERGVLPS
jgi:hypothetical protein